MLFLHGLIDLSSLVEQLLYYIAYMRLGVLFVLAKGGKYFFHSIDAYDVVGDAILA